jgi:hypothetical protein
MSVAQDIRWSPAGGPDTAAAAAGALCRAVRKGRWAYLVPGAQPRHPGLYHNPG